MHSLRIGSYMINSFKRAAALTTLSPDELHELLMKPPNKINLPAIAHVIDAGADLDIQSRYVHNALHLAASYGHTDAVKLLVDNGALVDVLNKNGNTALHFAANYGYTDCVRLMVDKGAILNAVNKQGYTAMGLAIRNNNKITIAVLNLASSKMPRPVNLIAANPKTLDRN
jgi:ankyrin repeat protein